MSFQISLVGTTAIFDISTSTTYKYKHEIVDATIYQRTRDGRLYTYNVNSEFHKFSIPLTNLSSDTAFVFNEWWSNQNVIQFTENHSTDPISTAFSCKLVNVTKPLNSYLDANFGDSRFNGTLLLETI